MSQDDPELRDAYAEARSVLVELARTDINAFIEFVMRDEQTNKPIEQARTHVRMQRACDDHDRLILWSHVEAGKSFQIAVARVLFILGTHQGATVAIVSDTHAQAAKIVRLIAKYVENSAEYHEVFPHVKRGEPWTSHHLYLEPIPGRIAPKDPSVQATNIGGNITGSRISHMVWDDILDLENTSTPAARNKVYTWLKSAECMGRLLEGAPLWCIGNAYHPDDSLHRLAREPMWHFMRLAVEDDRGQPTWPERWSAARIARKRLEAGPLEFARQMMCVARDDNEARFKAGDLDACCARGRGVPWLTNIAELLAAPWPLPRGALRALPTSPTARTASEPDRMADDGLASTRLALAKHDATRRAGARAQPGADAVRRAMGRRGQAQGPMGVDAAKLFPDVGKWHSTAHMLDPVAPHEVGHGDGVPAWLALRHERERSGSVRESTCWASQGGEVAPSARADAAGGALAPTHATPIATTLPHIVHTPQDGHARVLIAGGPRTGKTTLGRELAERLGVEARSTDDVVAPWADVPRILAGWLAEGGGLVLEGVQIPRLIRYVLSSGQGLGVDAVVWLDDVKGEQTAEHVRMTKGIETTWLKVRDTLGVPLLVNANADMVMGVVSSKSATPVDQTGAVEGGVEKMPTPVLFSGPKNAHAIATRPHGAPDGVSVALDSYAWLGSWLGDPGTPHRDDNGWPIHPRSLSQLKRMGIETFTGVDLAVQKHSAADYTVLYTIAVYPPDANGHRARRVLEIQRGKWYAMDICVRIIDAHDRFGSTVYVENVAAQDYIRQMILDGFERPDASQWLHGYTTGANKANPEFGVEHLAAEFAREQWIFPVPAAWEPDIGEDSDAAPSADLRENFKEILYYDPKEHTGDLLMAMWLAKEAARLTMAESKPAEIGVRKFR